MRLLKYTLVIFLLAQLTIVYAQSTDLEFEHFTTADGLVTNWMMAGSIEQDAQGFIWVGSDQGLHKYDGYNFTVFTHNDKDSTSISNNSINDIHKDSKGRLWIATNSGLNRWKPETESFIRYSFADSLGPIYFIYEDNKGNLLLVFHKTTDKLSVIRKLDPETGTIIKFCDQNDIDRIIALANNAIFTTYLDKNNILWFGAGNGLIKYNPQTSELKLFDLADARYYNNSDKMVLVITEDLSGKLLIVGKNSLYYFDRKNESLESLRNLKNNSLSIYAPEIDKNVSAFNRGYIFQSPTSKEYWIGIDLRGVNRFDSSGKLIKDYTKDFSHTIFEDRSGVLWLGTYSNGLYKANPSESNFEPQGYGMNKLNSLSGQHILGVSEDNSGNLWLGTTEEGLYKYNFKSKELRQYSYKTGNAKGLGSGQIFFVFMDSKSRIWVGTDRGLSLYNPKSDSFTTYYIDSKIEESEMFVNSYENSTGNLTFGIWKYPEHYTRYYSFNIDEDTGKGTFKYSPDYSPTLALKNNDGKVKGISWKIVEQYLSKLSLHSTFEDKNGLVWNGTSEGLFKYNPLNHQYKLFTTKDGLPVNTMGGILEDDDGYLWIANSAGLLKLNPDDDSFINFGKEDGLTNNLFEEWKAAYKSKSGLMYFGGFNGLTVIDPKRFKTNTVKPEVHITGIKIFGKSVPITKDGILNKSISFKKQIELSYNQNDITMEYVGLHYKNPEKNKYAYKLEPYEKGWKYVGDIRNAHYTNLSAGEYTYFVKASNSDGVWNETGTSISIIISPPWWETWWFRFASILILFVSAGSAIRYVEMKKIKRKIELLEQEGALERERTRISRDMHDEIGSNLSEIAILSELAKKKPSEAELHVQEISELTSEVIDNVSEIVWAMNPQNDKLDNLIAHTRRYAVKYLRLANINCRFVSLDDLPSHTLSAEFRRNIFLVVKEVLHNVVKHSCASEVLFAVNFSDHNLEMKIEDNGKGFIIEESHASGNGLSNMRKRIEDIGGFITIQSTCGKGTQVSFSAKTNS